MLDVPDRHSRELEALGRGVERERFDAGGQDGDDCLERIGAGPWSRVQLSSGGDSATGGTKSRRLDSSALE